MIQDWERANARMVEGQILADLFAGRGHQCPLCRQVSAKVSMYNLTNIWLGLA